jgi:hypothetical protein
MASLTVSKLDVDSANNREIHASINICMIVAAAQQLWHQCDIYHTAYLHELVVPGYLLIKCKLYVGCLTQLAILLLAPHL